MRHRGQGRVASARLPKMMPRHGAEMPRDFRRCVQMRIGGSLPPMIPPLEAVFEIFQHHVGSPSSRSYATLHSPRIRTYECVRVRKVTLLATCGPRCSLGKLISLTKSSRTEHAPFSLSFFDALSLGCTVTALLFFKSKFLSTRTNVPSFETLFSYSLAFTSSCLS